RCSSQRPSSAARTFVLLVFSCHVDHRELHSFPTRRSSDLALAIDALLGMVERGLRQRRRSLSAGALLGLVALLVGGTVSEPLLRSEEHTSELQSRENLVCRLLLEKKNKPKESAARRGHHDR